MGTDQSAEERRQVLGDDGELVKGDADVGLLVFAERRVGQPLQHLRQVLFVVRVRCIRRDANKKKQRRSHRPWPWPAVAATAQFPFETVGRSRWADPLSTVASTKGDQDNEEETTEGRNGAADEAACGRVVH